MHEMSVAMSIVQSVTDATSGDGGVVSAVSVRVGAMSGVIPEALRFAWKPRRRGPCWTALGWTSRTWRRRCSARPVTTNVSCRDNAWCVRCARPAARNWFGGGSWIFCRWRWVKQGWGAKSIGFGAAAGRYAVSRESTLRLTTEAQRAQRSRGKQRD